MVTCNEPTANYPSGLALLQAYDTNKDGIITADEATQAVTDFHAGALTQEEAVYVNDAYLIEQPINVICLSSAPVPMSTVALGLALLGGAVYALKKKKAR